MKSTILLSALLVMLLSGFSAADTQAPSFGPGDPEAEPESNKMDSSQSTIDMYLNGTMQAMYWVQIHEDPAAGQYWETSSKMSGMTMTNRWSVAKVDGDTAVVENESKMDSEYMISDYVIAYKVDLTKAVGEVNVTKAWIGKPGEKGEEIKVMEKPEAPACGGNGEEAEANTTEEEFADLELAGGKWSGKVITYKYGGGESKVWMADNAWFGGMIKMQSGDYVNELVDFGDDGKALLKLADEKDDKADDAKDPKDPETGDKPDGEKGEGKEDGKKDDKKDDADK